MTREGRSDRRPRIVIREAQLKGHAKALGERLSRDHSGEINPSMRKVSYPKHLTSQARLPDPGRAGQGPHAVWTIKRRRECSVFPRAPQEPARI